MKNDKRQFFQYLGLVIASTVIEHIYFLIKNQNPIISMRGFLLLAIISFGIPGIIALAMNLISLFRHKKIDSNTLTESYILGLKIFFYYHLVVLFFMLASIFGLSSGK